MRIAFIVEKFPAISETFILNQIIGLIHRGCEVDIYANFPGDLAKIHPQVQAYELLKCTYYQPSIPSNYILRLIKGLGLIVGNIWRNPVTICRSLNIFKYGKYALTLRLLYLVIPYLNSSPYDVIHCQFGMLGLQGVLLRDIGVIDGKIITSFRGFDISWYVQEFGEAVYENLFRKGDYFLANCNFFRQKALKIGCHEDKISIHYSGIDCSHFVYRPSLPMKGVIRIATTGRLIEKKGIEYAIKAINILVKTYPEIEYNIIGDGWIKAELEQLIISLGLEEQVKILGWKTQPEIMEILNHTQIFIAPSVTGKDGNQDAPVNTLKEAMSMGLPVIATLHGGIPELVQDGVSGFLVPERDEHAIAEKLKYLIEHPQIWEAMGKAGSEYVQTHFDTNKLNDELVQIYQRIADG